MPPTTNADMAALLPDVDPDELRAFTFAQVGERLGVSESTVRRMVRAGQLRTVSVWGKRRVLPGELRRYLVWLTTPREPRARRRIT